MIITGANLVHRGGDKSVHYSKRGPFIEVSQHFCPSWQLITCYYLLVCDILVYLLYLGSNKVQKQLEKPVIYWWKYSVTNKIWLMSIE